MKPSRLMKSASVISPLASEDSSASARRAFSGGIHTMPNRGHWQMPIHFDHMHTDHLTWSASMRLRPAGPTTVLKQMASRSTRAEMR